MTSWEPVVNSSPGACVWFMNITPDSSVADGILQYTGAVGVPLSTWLVIFDGHVSMNGGVVSTIFENKQKYSLCVLDTVNLTLLTSSDNGKS